MYGTSSWAISCSLATTASYAAFALTASHALNAGTGSVTNPGGSDQQIQYNNSGSFGGNSALVFVYTSQSLQQGSTTKAKGLYSHAEGWNNTASGSYTHAEGKDTTAIGLNSHTEGKDTLTLGDYAHAEGEFTTAQGRASHAEGLRTIASASYQPVVGQYNITSSIQSAFIVGNGTGLASRKNLIFAANNEVQITGSLLVTGSATIKGLTQSAGNNNVLTYNSTTGLLSYTASSAVGSTGGGSQFTYEIGQLVPSRGGIIGNRWMSGSTQWYVVVEQMTYDPLGTGDASTLGPIDPARLSWCNSYWDGNRTYMTSSVDGRINCTQATVITPSPNTGAPDDGLLGALELYYGTGNSAYANVNYYWLDSTSGYYEDMAVFTDWYIPAILELQALWYNIYKIDETLQRMYYYESVGSINNWGAANPLFISEYGSFSALQMWSSTEHFVSSEGTSYVMGLNRSTGVIEKINKVSSTRSVRRIRRFSI